MLEIILKRELTIITYEAEMKIGLQEKKERNIYLPFLKLASEFNGILSAKVINERLFFCPADNIRGKRMISYLTEGQHIAPEYEFDLDVIDENTRYVLTPLGKSEINSGVMTIPEEGAYLLSTTPDPLVPNGIIDCIRSNDTAKEELQTRKMNKNKKKNADTIKLNTLDWGKQYANIKQCIECPLPRRSNEFIWIYEIQPELIEQQQNAFEKSMKIQVKITQNSGVEIALDLQNNKDSKNSSSLIPFRIDDSLSYSDVLEELLIEFPESDIDKTYGYPVLLYEYNKLTKSEMKRFQKDVTISEPHLKKYGYFDPLLLKNINIAPKTIDDAVLWAFTILVEEINTYIDKPLYNELSKKIKDHFIGEMRASFLLPDYEQFVALFSEKRSVFFDEYDDMYHKILLEKPELFWFVTAPKVLRFTRGKL